MGLELLPMARGLGAITARGHVAPAAAAVLRVVVEDALAARIGAAANARQLAEDECISGRFDDGNDEARECIANRNERANERAVGSQLDAARSRAASERSAPRTRRASTSEAAAPAGCCRARRRIPEARSASSTSACSSQRTSVSKSRSASKRRMPNSQFTKSSQSRSPTKTKGERSIVARGETNGTAA